ncbi:MAG: glycosyltransferase [Clostridia bacterium]|nr:glycosyltransferase [Clostridia bacterium]
MLVSVLAVSYNNLEGLYPTFQSILDQDWPEIEIIVSDDSSRDYEEYQPKLARFLEEKKRDNLKRVVWNPHAQNGGTVKNTNSALRLAQGDYVISISPEDLLANEHALSDLVRCLQETGRDICFGKIRGQTPDGEFRDYLISCESDYDLLKSYTVEQTRNRLFVRDFLPAPAAMMTRKLFEENGLYPETTRLIEDYPYWLELTRKGVEFAYLDEVVVIYRLSGVSGQGNYGEAFMNDMFVIYEKYIFPYDRRYGILQPVYNWLKWDGLKFYMAKARWSRFPLWKRCLLRLRYLHFFVYTSLQDYRVQRKNRRQKA